MTNELDSHRHRRCHDVPQGHLPASTPMSHTPLRWVPPPIEHIPVTHQSASQRTVPNNCRTSSLALDMTRPSPFTDTPLYQPDLFSNSRTCCNKYLSSRSENPSQIATSEWCDRRCLAHASYITTLFQVPVAFLGTGGFGS